MTRFHVEFGGGDVVSSLLNTTKCIYKLLKLNTVRLVMLQMLLTCYFTVCEGK